jgi:hypothetical protein
MDYSLNLNDFICLAYVNLAPNTYGTHIQEYIRMRLDAIDVLASEERGDLMVTRKYFEVKASYLGQKNDSYNITHIRQWQNFDYYLLCFVDCDSDFTPNFFVIDKKILDMIKLSNMNGTPKSNKDNTNVEKRVTLKRNELSYLMVSNFNLLKDNTFESLLEFISDIRKNEG